MVFFLTMVRLRYSPTDDDLSLKVHQLLRRIWNINTHSDKREHVECVIYEEWAIEFLKKIWEDDFIDFESAIRIVQQNDKTFINFDEIFIFEVDSVYDILRSSKFKNSLLQFENVDNPFLYSIICGLLYNKLDGENIKLENTEKFLGTNLFTDLKKIEKKTMLDHSIFGYFDQCQLINEILSEHVFFLIFYERRNKF